jgi:hypothetical protein
MSCGGDRIALALGDAAEIRGEYVAVLNGRDLIHFTHPADGSCGTKGDNPDGDPRLAAGPVHGRLTDGRDS